MGSKASALDILPGLKGFGTETRAAYGAPNPPVICIVANLSNDDQAVIDANRNGIPVKTGSLIECINYTPPSGSGKIILFEVSGTIHAEKEPFTYFVDDPYTTIVGQSAPSPGITLRNIMLHVRTNNVLIQHLRIRIGDAVEGVNPEYRRAFSVVDATLGRNLFNIVVDHCSFSWGIDINVLASAKYGTGEVRDITYSNNIFSECLNLSLHSKGHHSKGVAVQHDSENILLSRNLIAHNVDRNPFVRRGKSAIVNNLIYNPRDQNIILKGTDGDIYASIVGNVIKGGPNSGTNARSLTPIFWSDLTTTSRIFIDNNKTDTGTQKSASDWSSVKWGGGLSDLSSQVRILTPQVWPDNFSAIASTEVEQFIIDHAGARPAERDVVDKRVISEVIHRSGRIIDSPQDVGGWPVLAENRITHILPNNPHGDDDGDGYTNLEEWYHGLAASVERLMSSPAELKIKSTSS